MGTRVSDDFVCAQAFQCALDEAVHFLATGETAPGFDRALLPEGGDAPADGGDGYGGSGGKPRPKPRDGKGIAKKDGALAWHMGAENLVGVSSVACHHLSDSPKANKYHESIPPKNAMSCAYCEFLECNASSCQAWQLRSFLVDACRQEGGCEAA
jgi:hypothetical protein